MRKGSGVGDADKVVKDTAPRLPMERAFRCGCNSPISLETKLSLWKREIADQGLKSIEVQQLADD